MGWWKNLLLILINYRLFSKSENFYHFLKKNIINLRIKACSSVDRASDSDSESQGFDSLHAYGLTFKEKNSWGCFGFDI